MSLGAKQDAAKTHDTRVREQIAQYANVEHMHSQLPTAFQYWQQKFFRPKFLEVTGFNNYIEFYAKTFADRIDRTGNNRFVSLGSGDGEVELQVAQAIKRLGVDEFEFHLVELSPIQNQRAVERTSAAGFAKQFRTIEADFNKWRPDTVYAGAMAHHALHHVVELEHLFDAIVEGLHEDGVFATFDLIGRNGHMRWPEAYALIDLIWQMLPQEKRKHHILNRIDEHYLNHDCSTQGFEGIRAQDILPNLIERFHFETFFAFGNLIDVFTSRGYGPNFDPRIKEDAAFIDFIEELNELLIELAYLKPTRMCAIMAKKPGGEPRLYRSRTPAMMMRAPDIAPPEPN